MNRIRQIAITLIALALVTAAVYSTGAFDSFTTQRNANVQVVGDAAGYLALQPAEGPNGAYATYEGGELALRLDGSIEGGPAGAGVNPGGRTTIDDVFTITNRGVQSVAVWLTNENEAVELQHDGDSFESAQRAVTLDPGDSIPIGIEIDTTGTDDPSLESDLTVHVEGEATVQDPPQGHGETNHHRSTETQEQWSDETRSTDSTNDSQDGDSKGVLKEITNLIQENAEFLQKHKSKLLWAAHSTPAALDDIVVWMLLNPDKVGDTTRYLPGCNGNASRSDPSERSRHCNLLCRMDDRLNHANSGNSSRHSRYSTGRS